jgi:hypothetical protein
MRESAQYPLDTARSSRWVNMSLGTRVEFQMTTTGPYISANGLEAILQEEELGRGHRELQEWIDRGDRIAKAADYRLTISRYGNLLLEVK